jgi:hypothetical protein
MSTPEPSGITAERPAERTLFRALFDDAAVFPPGLAPLPQAVTDHLERQSSSYADLVGPLLLPAGAIEDLRKLELPQLEVALIGRPGSDLAVVGEALAALNESPTVTVTGLELGWSRDWHQSWIDSTARLGRQPAAELPRSIEVPRGPELEEALSELQAHAHDHKPVGPLQAKFRTGSTPEQAAPTPKELATFIRACVDHDLSFKLTGGLHHAISQTSPATDLAADLGEDLGEDGAQDQIGFLNVLAATRWALAHGAEIPEMEALLSQRDPAPILDIITRMSEADASVVRAFFTSYGCCGVLDPIGDLAALGLITEPAV